MSKSFALSLFILLVFSVPAFAQENPPFEATPCPVEIPSGFVEDTGPNGIECGFVTVPEFHANRAGNQIRLMVAVIHSSSPSPQADPLFIGQGGPGGSTLELFVRLATLFGQILTERDVVLVEQRGTKYSEPALECPELLELGLEYISVDNSTDEMAERQINAYQSCFDRHIAEGVNLSAFNSVENAADMIAVADALGYEQINFYGVSYGTMLGQHLLRDFESRLRSIIFDAVVPLERSFIPDILQSATNARAALFTACEADSFCNETFPELEATFWQTYDELNANPVTVPVTDPDTGIAYDAYLDGNVFAATIRLLLYSSEILPGVPAFIDAAATGDYDWFERLYPALAIDATRDMAQGMYATVMCAEDADFSVDDIVTDTVNPQIVETQLPGILSLHPICENAGIETLDNYVDNPVVSDIPALITSGQFDPITPASNGDILAGNLSNSTHLTFPGIGHGAMFGGFCPLSIITNFLSNPDDTPDSSCIEDMSPRFVSLTTDPTGRLQFAQPENMTDVSTDTYASYEDESETIRISIIAMDGTETDTAMSEALSIIIRESFDIPPLANTIIETPFGQMANNVYQDGTGIIAILALVIEDTTAVVIAEFPPEQIFTVNASLNLLVGVMIQVD